MTMNFLHTLEYKGCTTFLFFQSRKIWFEVPTYVTSRTSDVSLCGTPSFLHHIREESLVIPALSLWETVPSHPFCFSACCSARTRLHHEAVTSTCEIDMEPRPRVGNKVLSLTCSLQGSAPSWVMRCWYGSLMCPVKVKQGIKLYVKTRQKLIPP